MSSSTERSGQITVTTAGTAVQGTDVVGGAFLLKAHADNTGIIYVGNVSGDVASTNGYPLEANEDGIEVIVGNLSALWFDSSVNGEKCCWIRVR